MEEARDVVTWMEREGRGRILDQFGNPDNPRAHENGTDPELWAQTDGRIMHFVSAMGTTGTITGVSRFLTSRNPGVQIVGAQPAQGSRIPGIRAWPPEYVPTIFDPSAVDRTGEVTQTDAEEAARRLAREEGIFGGISAAGACWTALQVAENVEGATVVCMVCNRSDRYLSSGRVVRLKSCLTTEAPRRIRGGKTHPKVARETWPRSGFGEFTQGGALNCGAGRTAS